MILSLARASGLACTSNGFWRRRRAHNTPVFVAACAVRATDGWLGEGATMGCEASLNRLFLVQILFRHVVLRDLVRVDFPFLIFICVFDTRYDVGLERISFLDQLVDAFRISAFNVP
jgi:hypothetical protein